MTMENFLSPADPAPCDELSAQVSEHFSVRDEQTANWVVRRVNEARAYRRRVEEWAAGEIRRAQAEEQFFLGRFGGQLREWLQQQITTRHLRRKSLALPSGTIGLRRSPPRLAIQDEAKAVQWARQHLPYALRAEVKVTGPAAQDLRAWCQENCRSAQITESLLREELGEYVESCGEIPEGVEVQCGEERFYVA